MYQKRILLFQKRRSKSTNDVKRKAETDGRKHRNVHGPFNGSSKSITKDIPTLVSPRRTRSSVKLKIENENEITEDENSTTSANHDSDIETDFEPDSTQAEIEESKASEIAQVSKKEEETSVRHNGSSNGRESVLPHDDTQTSVHRDNYNQIIPKLPQIMSTRGSPRNDGLCTVDKIYKSTRTYPVGIQNISHDQKPHHTGKTYRPRYEKDSRGGGSEQNRYHHSRYEAETQSTWTLNYVDKTKKKYTTSAIDDYYMPRDSYMTMVSLKNEKDKETYEEKNDYYKNNTRIEEADSRTDIEKEGLQSSIDGEPLTPPPELIRVDESSNQSIKSETSIPLLDREATREVSEEDVKVEVDDSEHVTSSTNVLEYANPDESLDGEENQEKTKFVNLRSPGRESNSTLDTSNDQDIDEFAVKENVRDSSEVHLLPHHQLSEAAIEQLITVPVTGGGDSSWKHAKQVYSCPLCAKVFPFKSKLQRHVLVHTRIKPYKCTVCGRGFTQQIDLQRHLTRHTGEKPFKCHLCSAQFIRADNLRKHCKDAHYIVIEEPIRKRRRRTTGSDTVLPSLEVAIALAFSETERNGGRVLGRTVTRSNPRNARGNNQFNKTHPNPPTEMPALIEERPSGRFAHSPSRQSGQEQIAVKYHGKMSEQPTQGSEVKPPFPSHQRKGIVSNELLRRYENVSPSAGYLSAPDYDRTRDIDSKEYLIRMRGDKREIMSPEQRYQMEYRTYSPDISGSRVRYRRSSETDHVHNGYRRVYPDPRYSHRNMELHEKSRPYPYVVSKDEDESEGIGERGELVERDARAPHRRYLPRLVQAEASDIPYYTRKSDKVSLTRKLAYEYSSYRNAEFSRKLGIRGTKDDCDQDNSMPRVEEMYRYNKNFQSKNMIYDPGEYVSMAKETDNEEDVKVNVYDDCGIKQESRDLETDKSGELTSSQLKQYVDEEEIPIVRRSDEITTSYEEKQN